MTTITTSDELPLYVDGPDGTIFTILTVPPKPNGVAVILVPAGLYGLSVNRNRFSVLLARTLAASGYHALRLDLHGAGESTGDAGDNRLDVPFSGDVIAAVRRLEMMGLERFVFVGSCFGGRSCLAAAASVEGLIATAFLSVPPTDDDHSNRQIKRRAETPLQVVERGTVARRLKGLRSRETRARYAGIVRVKLAARAGRTARGFESVVSPGFRTAIDGLSRRGIPTLLAYGTEPMAADFDKFSRGSELGPILDRFGDQVEVHRPDVWLHGFPSLRAQRVGAELLDGWLTRIGLPGFDAREMVPVD